MELSIEELTKLKEAVIGNISTLTTYINKNFVKYAEGEEISELLDSIKELSDIAALLQKIYNAIELNKLAEQEEQE